MGVISEKHGSQLLGFATGLSLMLGGRGGVDCDDVCTRR